MGARLCSSFCLQTELQSRRFNLDKFTKCLTFCAENTIFSV